MVSLIGSNCIFLRPTFLAQSTSSLMSANSPTPSPLFDRKLNTGIATPAPFQVLFGSNVNPSFTMVSLLALGASCKIRSFPF